MSQSIFAASNCDSYSCECAMLRMGIKMDKYASGHVTVQEEGPGTFGMNWEAQGDIKESTMFVPVLTVFW